MYHKPRMCRTCLQMARGDFKFVNLDSVDPLWESNSPNLKEQLIYIVPEMKLESTDMHICTSCFIALRTAYEFKMMCQVTEQKFQSHNYKYRRPFGVGPGSPQFHVTLNENSNNPSSVPTYRCQNLNYLQTDTSIDITEHHLYDASKVLPRKQLAYLNNVSQKLPEIDVEVIMSQNSDKSDKTSGPAEDSKENKNEKPPENKIESKSDNKSETKPESKVDIKTEKKYDKKIESKSQNKSDKTEVILESKTEIQSEKKKETKPEMKVEKKTKEDEKKTNEDEKITKEDENKKKEDEKKTKEVEKKTTEVEKKTKEDEKKETGVQKLIFPNLPGIEIVPKKLDSLELRKKYNIGSQISILKTPKQISTVETILKKACEEIPYLKTNNVLPEALNCSIRLEILTSQLTTRVTAEKYTATELEEIAKTYYTGCSDTLLDCKLCSRSFSTEHWLKIHEEEHANPKRVEESITVEAKKETVTPLISEEIKSVELIPKPKEAEECVITPTSVQAIVKEVTSNTSKITIPIQLQNDQISITPIQKSSTITNSKQITKITEKPIETKQEPAISLSTIKKSPVSTNLADIISTSEVSLIQADNIQETLKSEEIIPKTENLPTEEKEIIEEAKESFLTPITSNVDEDAKPIPESKTELVKTDIQAPAVPKAKRRFKTKHFKSLSNKNKLIGVKYQKCFVCLKSFKSKLSLNQHCKFIHIPNVSSSSYWSNFITHIKEQKHKNITVDVDDKEVEEENGGNDNEEVEELVEEGGEREDEMEEEGEEIQEEEESKEIIEPIETVEVPPIVVNQHICNICDKVVKEEAHLSLHMYVHTPTFASMDPETRADENADIFRCYLCEKTFPKERYLKLHNLQVHLKTLVVCKICSREFKSEFWFSRHKCVIPSEIPEPEEEIFDEEGKEFSCTLCDRKFARVRFMKSHRKRMHKNLLEKSAEANVIDSVKTLRDRNDSEESEHSGYESNREYDFNDETKEHESLTRRTENLNEISRRRSLSRGVPKIQCDFCGEYIEETAYDKHIFEHNKLRLNKSLSKRKSLESTYEEVPEKKEILLKCHICYKSFKRRHNLIGHMSKHEGVENFEHITGDYPGNLSEADDTFENESETYLSESEENRTIAETVHVVMSMINGFDIYTCCERQFRLKAHFFRHFKRKHVDCILKFKYEGDAFEKSEEHSLMDTSQLETSAEQLELKREIKLEKHDDTEPDTKMLDESELDTTSTEQNISIMSGADSTVQSSAEIKTETGQTESAPKKRKYTRRTFPSDINSKNILGLRKVQKHDLSTDKDENISGNEKASGIPLTTNNLNKRKLSMDSEGDGIRKSSKTPKLIRKSDKIDGIEGEEGEDMAATALHLRQLDLLPITTKILGGYECHICERKFKQKCQLRDHFNVHTGDRPYKCDFCKPVRGFTQTSSLYVHFRRVHAVVTKNCSWEVYSKNGDCLICSDVFFKHSQMFDHMKTYYVENEYECHICNKKFSMTCHFKTHDIDPEDMQHLFIKDEADASNEDEDETLPENETDEKLQSDSDTERMSEAEDNPNKEPLIRCSKCDKTFDDKQQLRFHKKSLAHFQQIQAKRRKIKTPREEQVEEEEEDADPSNKTDATDTIEDIENGVKAIIKKIRIFKKHHCNICGSSFIRRMQLKKHKRTHKLRRSKSNIGDNLEETTTLELQDASELNQFIHDDNLTDEEDEDERSNEIELELNSTEEIADSTVNSEEQPVTSVSSENSDLQKTDVPFGSPSDNAACNLNELDENSGESTLSTNVKENEISEENSLNAVDIKMPDLNEQILQTNIEDDRVDILETSSNADVESSEKVCLADINELPQNNLEFIITENDTFDHMSLSEEPDLENDNLSTNEDETTNVTELTIDDLRQSEMPINENFDDASLENIETPADYIITTNESASISKECDVQSISKPSLLNANETPSNDLVLDEQNLISDQYKCLALDK